MTVIFRNRFIRMLSRVLLVACLGAVTGCGTVAGILGKGRTSPAPTGPVAAASSTAPVAAPPTGTVESPVTQSESVTLPAPAVPPAPVAPRSESRQKNLAGIARMAQAASQSPVLRNLLITEDTTWRGEVAVEGWVRIAPQTTLTIEPGTVVRFRRTTAGIAASPGLLVQGRLVVRGSSESPVRFTSANDTPVAGEWYGIILLASEKKNIIEQCIIEGAVMGLDASYSTVTMNGVRFRFCGTGARLAESVAAISGGEMGGSDLGMDLDGSEIDLRDTRLSGNASGLKAKRSSLYLAGVHISGCEGTGLDAVDTRLRLEGGVVERCEAGIILAECEGSVTRTIVAANRRTGLHLSRSRVKVSGSEITRNDVGLMVDDDWGIAWGNSFSANGAYDIYNAGSEDFRAMANWWGPGQALETIGDRLYDGGDDPARGGVLVAPLLDSLPILAVPNSVAK